ncbi:MAG: hypothetical protein U5N86_11800 [Planctomycetota bacterium]|nr:hypothetical protein [Planctomycetota bacterium]
MNPASNYADKLLLISARAYALNDITSALRALSKLIVDYPASPIIDEAKSLRDKLRR